MSSSLLHCRNVVLATLLAGALPLRAEDERLWVRCPAVDERDDAGPSAPPDAFGPDPELIVVGPAKALNVSTFEITVEQVLMGHWNGKTIEVASEWTPEEGAFIWQLGPCLSPEGPRFFARYPIPAGEAFGEAALGRARLRVAAMSSRVILEGKWKRLSDSNSVLEVQVIRRISGECPAPGSTVRYEVNRFTRGQGGVCPWGENAIFFSNDFPDEARGMGPSGAILKWMQPVESLEEVRRALQSEDSLPVNTDENGWKWREVLFDGTCEEAVKLVEAGNDAIALLGTRYLFHRCPSTDLEKLIAARLGETERASGWTGLRRMIAVLGRVEMRQDTGAIGRLVDAWMDVAAKGGETPHIPTRSSGHRAEEGCTDVNHALAWLLVQLPPATVLQDFGPRLLTLREKLAGGWKAEVQVALDACGIEEALDLADALRRSAKEPRRTAGGLSGARRSVSAFALSASGDLLAAADDQAIRVWRMSDASLVVKIPRPGDVGQIEILHDQRRLRALFWDQGERVVDDFDLSTGKKLRELFRSSGAWKLMPSLADGSVVLAETEQGVASVRESGNGAEVAQVKCGEGFAASVDGRRRAIFSESQRLLTVTTFPPKPEVYCYVPGEGSLFGFEFSPDGEYVAVAARENRWIDDAVVATVFRATNGEQLSPGIALKVPDCCGFRISPDGRQVYFPTKRGQLWRASFPDFARLELAWQAPSTYGNVSVAFARDGSRFAAQVEYKFPEVVESATLKRILPGTGLTLPPAFVRFSTGGELLLTASTDGAACLWDTVQLKVLRRHAFPPGFDIATLREDGRFAALLREWEQNGKDHRMPMMTLKVVDLESGQVCATDEREINPNGPRFAWKGAHELIVDDRRTIEVLDIRGNRPPTLVPIAEGHDWSPVIAMGEDGTTLFHLPGGGPRSFFRIRLLDIASGAEINSLDASIYQGRAAVLVPGGKFLAAYGPGVAILDRRALNLVSQRSFHRLEMSQPFFSMDGAMYAVIVSSRPIDPLRREKTELILRVHETATGKTLFAFELDDPPSSNLAFSPSAKEVVFATMGGSLRLWPLK